MSRASLPTAAIGLMACLSGALSPRVLTAAELVCDLDPGQTRITFTLGAALHTVHGSFRLESGSVRLDTETGRASGEIVIDVASGETGNRSRDRRMHEEVLESARYPEARFTVENFEGKPLPQGESTITVRGRLTLHGAEHPLELPLQVKAEGSQATATTHFEIPYVAWGMKSPNTLLLKVRDHVDVEIHAVGQVRLAASE